MGNMARWRGRIPCIRELYVVAGRVGLAGSIEIGFGAGNYDQRKDGR